MQSKLLMINQDTKMSLKRKYNDEDDLKNQKVSNEDLKEKLPKNKFKKYKSNDKNKEFNSIKIEDEFKNNEKFSQNSSMNLVHKQNNESKEDQFQSAFKNSVQKPIENYYNQLNLNQINNYNLLMNKEKFLNNHLLDNNYLQLLNYQNCLIQKSFELNFLPNLKQNIDKNINNSIKNQILKPELNINNFHFDKANFNRPCRRQRTTFTNEQTFKLEIEYRQNEYISRNKRFQLADLLDLTENQIKIWFQNRRAKDKRIEKALLDQQFKFLVN